MFTDSVNKGIISGKGGMRVFFKDRKIERLCMQERFAKKELGGPCARKLNSRLSDLWAADNPTELPAGHPHPLTGDRYGQFAVTLHGGKRLCFEPREVPWPKHASGGIDWARINAIVIVFIGDYHD